MKTNIIFCHNGGGRCLEGVPAVPKSGVKVGVIFYATLTEGAGPKLKRLLDRLVPEENIQAYRTVEDLSHRLSQPVEEGDIVVLLVSSKEELEGMLSIADLLRDVRIILILPNRDDDTVAKGHTLRPRFLSYMDSDFAEIGAVLSKMLQGLERPGD